MTAVALRTSLIWHDEVMGDVVVAKPKKITLGRGRRSTFVVPDLGLPPEFAVVRPGNRGYLLTLGEHMRGTICLDGQERDVADLVRLDVPEVEPYLAPVVARGRTRGHPWVASGWTPRRRRALAWPWPRRERQWAVADRVVTYVPRPEAIQRYEAARDAGLAGIRSSYWGNVDAAFAVLGNDRLARYRSSTPLPDVPVVAMFDRAD